jgi:hypothetical protein
MLAATKSEKRTLGVAMQSEMLIRVPQASSQFLCAQDPYALR